MPHIIELVTLIITPSRKAGYDAISVRAKDSTVNDSFISVEVQHVLLHKGLGTSMSHLLGSIEESRQSAYVDRLSEYGQVRLFYGKRFAKLDAKARRAQSSTIF
jgi:hypothetical protein